MANDDRPQQPAAPTSDQGSIAVKERPRTAPPRVDSLPPFRVLLHNDDVNAMDHVVHAIQYVAAHPLEQAVRVMLEAHKRGVALVTITHKERAELMKEQFEACFLTCTIEPAD